MGLLLEETRRYEWQERPLIRELLAYGVFFLASDEVHVVQERQGANDLKAVIILVLVSFGDPRTMTSIQALFVAGVLRRRVHDPHKHRVFVLVRATISI